MPTLVNLTFDVADLIGADFDARRTKVWIETNIASGSVIDTTGKVVRLGDVKATVGADGKGTFTGLFATNSADLNPTGFLYQVYVDYATRADGRKLWSSGWFPLTASSDLALVSPVVGGPVNSTDDAVIASRVNALGSLTRTAIADRWPVNVRDYGAVGDGVTNDRQAFVDAAATGRPVFVPNGNYLYSGAGLDGMSAPVFIGADKSKTTITLSAGSYFLDSTTAWLSMHVANIKFSGGAGVLRNRWVGINVNGHRIVDNCQFKDYTACAVSSNATDEPYWNFYGCQFDAANETFTIGVALAGKSDGASFTACSFLRNRIDVKLRRPFTTSFIRCDFVPYGSGDGTAPRAGIWYTLADSGRGCVADSCKFGNEGITALDYHILIADDTTPTGLVGDSFPVLTADSTGTLSGMQFTRCDVQGASGANPPLVYSTAADLRGFVIDYPNIVGTAPAYLVQFRTPPAASRLNQDSVIGPLVGSSSLGTEGVPMAATNAAGWAKIIDPQVFLSQATMPSSRPGADPTGYVKLLAAGINAFTLAAATRVAITDPAGGTDAAELDYTDPGGFIHSGLTTASIAAGVPAWVEFDLMAGATSPLTSVEFRLQYTGNGVIHFRRHIAVPASGGWVRHRFLWTPREAATTILAMFYGGALGKVKIGRVRVYHAREPLPERLSLPDVPTATTAPAAGGAGALPATPAGYLSVSINGVARQVAYY